MTITISQVDYNHLWQQGIQGQSIDDRPNFTTERVEVCPPVFGVGSKRWVTLRDIDLLIHDYEFHCDVEVHYCPDQGGLEFGFQLQGGRMCRAKFYSTRTSGDF